MPLAFVAAEYYAKLLPILLVFGGLLAVVPLLVFLERKICAFIQERVGPNRVGLLGPDSAIEGIFGSGLTTGRILGGFMQPLADAVKLLAKEDIIPRGVDKFLFTLAPFFALLPPFLAFIVIPVGADVVWNGQLIKLLVADLDIGVLWILVVASLSPYGVALGGWASNSKYSLLGGIRATAQMISYEIGMGIVLVAMVMHYQGLSLREVVLQQSADLWHWGIFYQPLAFILFGVCAFAENNRLPFDLPECEAELVGGYHTEYSSMKFGMFFQGEYVAMLAMGALLATLFLGGWHYPGYATLMQPVQERQAKYEREGVWDAAPGGAEAAPRAVNAAEARARAYAEHPRRTFVAAALSVLAFGLKVMGFVIFSMWVRWTLPRFRYDQVMRLGWRVIIPLALVNLVLTALVNIR